MKTLLFLLLSLGVVSGSTLQAQKSARRFAGRYEADFGPGESERWTAYQWVVTKTSEGEFIRRFYFPETKQLISETRYSHKKLRPSDRDGLSRSWYDDGVPRHVTTYRDGKQEGESLSYHPNGELFSRGAYANDKKVEVWEYYDWKGRVSRRTHYVDGLRQGPDMHYDSLGTVTNTVMYTADEAVSGDEVRTAPGRDGSLVVVEEMPLFPGCERLTDYAAQKKCADRAMLEFIYRTVRYPDRARRYGVQGMAVVSFIIETDGRVTGITPLMGLNEDIRREIVRIVELMPRWHPGRVDGQAVRVQFNLPVKFELE
ncbi:energy transducer TonB [Lewinella sp. IMCC34183]|uniref:energy transducer TonB n=1 Tax=Lewinella sp. IMCC34183 TaxID=2248762 RepID=UPI000E22D1B7|nr:energy transducer TonB [Lewinella sp. IMCC34183]